MEGFHYNDVIMGVYGEAFIITGVSIVYSTVYSGVDQRKHQSSASLTSVWCVCVCVCVWGGGGGGDSPVIGQFPAQRASIAENVSIRWRH